MTADRVELRGPLGRRLLAAFLLVAVSSVTVLTVAALVGTDRGLAGVQRSERQQATSQAAQAAATAYREAGGWARADLRAAAAIASAAGARLSVRDTDDTHVWPGRGMGPGTSGMHADTAGGTSIVERPVIVEGQTVGTIRLAFVSAPAAGRAVAWSWVVAAGVVALVVALIVSWYVARRLTRPLLSLAGTARRFASGERAARASTDGPGELGEVARAFNDMADDVVRAEQIRRNVAADVAHELRTPLAALQAGLEELRDGLGEANPQRLAALHDQALRLGRVVEDLSDLAAAESAALALRLTDADLTEIARTALEAQRPKLDAAGLVVSTALADPVPVRADPDRLHQALANLLSNAARYCALGDRVSVRVHRTGNTAVVEVADTGPGIPGNELPHVFDRLWRGQRARAIAGSGIGLTVVRELVTAHGGTVAAVSPAGGGATFTIRLPAGSPADPVSDRHRPIATG